MADPSIAVVGAAGFVGRALLSALADAELRATAVVRGIPETVSRNDFHAVHSGDVGELRSRFDVVVNLAYPTSHPVYDYPRQNEAIFRTVESLLVDGGRLIHVSSQAVFGSALELPVHVGPVRPRRDVPYVEAKLDAEAHFAQRHGTRGWSVDIVRPGLIWGRGSGGWGTPLVQRLLLGRAVGIKGVDGYSNATDVANTASYLAFLAGRSAAAGVRYHHLAEFSSVRWSEWIRPTAATLRVEPVYAEPDELAEPAVLAGALSARTLYRNLAERRVGGSWTRTALRLLPDGTRSRLKGQSRRSSGLPPLSADDRVYVAVMASTQEFRPALDPAWSPPVDREESLARFLAWVDFGS